MLSASKLKKRGISTVKDHLTKDDKVIEQAREDYAKGRVTKESAKAHFKRLGI
jgi:uncharacterized membrane protein